MLNNNQIEELKAKLLDLKKNLTSQLENIAEKDETIKDNYKAKFPDLGRKPEDNIEEMEEYESNLGIEHTLETELQAVNEALAKIKEGTYGKCENCQGEISFERLQARPQAKQCLSCKQS
jgi:RNA polymerase-binding protein DksA